jgi:hypothetical protein
VIPFFHQAPFADGANHPSQIALREQLGPLFETLGLPLVLTAHDQAYERTFPLRDIGSGDTPTSSALDCYELGEDGVTFVKISPGGKLSNISGGFSPFRSDPAPAWTAVRNNTRHVFGRLAVRAEGRLRLEVFGVVGDTGPVELVDSFEYVDGSCGPALELDVDRLDFALDEGELGMATTSLVASDGSAVDFGVSVNAPWLGVDPAAGTTPAALGVSVDSTALAPGTHTATLTASPSSGGVRPVSIPVFLTVGATEHAILVSGSADRSSPVFLEGAVVSGSIYVFLSPESGVTRVRFYLDDPDFSGSAIKIENNPPWDFAGTGSGASNPALPFDTGPLSEGAHVISARADLAGGGVEAVHASFVVEN